MYRFHSTECFMHQNVAVRLRLFVVAAVFFLCFSSFVLSRFSLSGLVFLPSELHHGRRAAEGTAAGPGRVLHRPHGAVRGARRRPRRPGLHVVLHGPVWRERPVEVEAARPGGSRVSVSCPWMCPFDSQNICPTRGLLIQPEGLEPAHPGEALPEFTPFGFCFVLWVKLGLGGQHSGLVGNHTS